MERQEGRRLFTWGLTLILCLTLLMPCAAFAAEVGVLPTPVLREYVVTANVANLYNEPVATETALEGILVEGATFRGHPEDDGDGTWVRVVEATDGVRGFVQAADVELAGYNLGTNTGIIIPGWRYVHEVGPRRNPVQTEEPTAFIGTRLYYMVDGTNVNVRSMPSMEGVVFTQYDTGKLVEVLSIENGWARIQFGNLYAYIAVNLLDTFTLPENVTYTGPDALNVLDSDGDVIGSLNANTTVRVTEIDEDGMATIEYGDGYDGYAYVLWDALWSQA